MSRRRKKGGRDRGFLPDIAAPERGAPRRKRVERDLRDLLVEVIAQLSDPRLDDVAINRIELTDDLSFARIFVREGIAASTDGEGMVDGLEAAGGKIRREVARRLQMRRAPELRFVYDEGVDHSRRVDELLAEIHDEGSAVVDDGEDDPEDVAPVRSDAEPAAASSEAELSDEEPGANDP